MRRSRRHFLGAIGLLAGIGVAGCIGDEDGPPATGDTVDDLPAPTLGAAGPRVRVFEDFSCPSCRQFKMSITPRLFDEHVEPGEIQYEHRDFPFINEASWQVASGARAVQDHAGDEAFFEFATSIYDHQGAYDLDIIESVADDVAGIGGEARAGAEQMTYRPVLEADFEFGEDLGIAGTPGVAVEDSVVSFDGLETTDDVYDAIVDAIETASG